MLALLVGCTLGRNELAELEIEAIQQREGRWVLTTSRARAGDRMRISAHRHDGDMRALAVVMET
jgi:hypothetical protein